MSAPEKRSLRERLRPKERKPAVRWLLTVLLLAAAVLGLHMLLQMIGTLDFSRGRFSSYLHVPKIYLLNLLPVALLVAFTYFATNRAWLGFLIPSVLLFIMDFVNYFKVTLRGDPFVAEDFLTIGEGAGIIGQYTLHFPLMFFAGIALIAAGTIVLHRWRAAACRRSAGGSAFWRWCSSCCWASVHGSSGTAIQISMTA